MASKHMAPRKWAIDFGEAAGSVIRDVPDPLGFNRQVAELDDASSKAIRMKDVDAEMKQAKAWEAATAPVKNLFMLGFMLWMAGSTVQIFSIGIIISALWQPISALRSLDKVFEPFQDPRADLMLPKLVFVAVNTAALGIALFKLNTLGLLPTHISDWLSSLPPTEVQEFSGGGLSFP